jgi:sigma-B regulation protein RsbU (phosphoserine phosphatase)
VDSREKILVADRTIQATDLISHWLQTEDVTVYTAESGLNAQAKLELFKPDILIVNVDLPDMSGFDLCKKVKDDSDMRYTMVLCVSSLESETNRLRAMEVGADDYIDAAAEHYLFLSKVRSLLRVKRLSNQLRQKYAELEEKNTLLDKQLEMGMQVQRALIPDIDTRFKDTRIISRYFPAMGVGGDFYNMLPLTENSFGIVIGDVSGHGIAAAFITAMLNMMIKNLTPKYFNPDQLLFFLNNELYTLFEKSDSSLYACVFYAVVNTKEHYVRYANAGQCLPFYVAANDNTVNEMESTGLPIGMMKDSRYDMKTLSYNRADVLLFHTDGLQDIYYKEQPDEFTSRMKDILSKMRFVTHLREILDVICDNFYHAADSETARLEMDDASMIICRL